MKTSLSPAITLEKKKQSGGEKCGMHQNLQASNVLTTVRRCTKALVLPAQNDLVSSVAVRLRSLRGTERLLAKLSQSNLSQTKHNISARQAGEISSLIPHEFVWRQDVLRNAPSEHLKQA